MWARTCQATGEAKRAFRLDETTAPWQIVEKPIGFAHFQLDIQKHYVKSKKTKNKKKPEWAVLPGNSEERKDGKNV